MKMEKPLWLRGWKLGLLVYLVLLLVSQGWRFLASSKPALEPGYKSVQVNAVNKDRVLENKPVEIAYREFYRGTASNPPVIILLHGSPVAGNLLSKFARKVSTDYRIVVPDLPGFDQSKQQIPDYSMRSYATYLNQFMNVLELEEAHLAGYSFGGGVAIKFAHYFPEKVHSLVLMSALGVQELELLGGYTLNHAIHWIQLAMVWVLHEAVPHFGLLDEFPIDRGYARSFYDSDQRPIRSYLKSYKKPMLILHGRKDGLVPLVAAREHHRLVPQSRLILYEGGHIALMSNADKMASDTKSFLGQVEQGKARTYAGASPERIKASKRPFKNIDFARFEGLALALIMMIIIISTFVTEDLTCIGAGLMAARGLIGFWPATIACFLGILIGDMGLYLVGRKMGRAALKRAPFKWMVSQKDLERTSNWFERRGPAIIIASRFLPGSRLPTYFSAGVIGAGFWMFSFYFLVAAVLWTPLLVGISMLVGTELLNYFSLYKHYALPVFAGGVLLLLLIVKVVIPSFSYRGRRLLVSRWCRLSRWEFWPPYIIYIPVCCYIVWLWIKFGTLTLFTSSNPGIEDGGFIGESKKLILDRFSGSGLVARYYLLPSSRSVEKRLQLAVEFMEKHGLSFPVVIKPDAGQRGEGVHICHNKQQLKSTLVGSEYDQIIQEYAEGREYGIFYYRYPGHDTGHIYSITGKELITIEGDGEQTVEELILGNNRAVCLAQLHMDKFEEQLYEIPGKGEVIDLVELGTHARGARFYDATELATNLLESTIDEITRKAGGYYFGRFDVKVPDAGALQKAKDLKIIEVNGVTSESTNIYDAHYSFWDAQKILMKQWYIAYEIGNEHYKRGVEPSSTKTLVRKLFKYQHKD